MKFLDESQEARLVAAIHRAEQLSSGEIRIHLEPECAGEAMDRAQQVFEQLGMTKTAERNGVLVYLAYADKKFAILGDQGIHERVGSSFWEEQKTALLNHFQSGHYLDGLEAVVLGIGKALAEHFPHQGEDDVDELPNEISRG